MLFHENARRRLRGWSLGASALTLALAGALVALVSGAGAGVPDTTVWSTPVGSVPANVRGTTEDARRLKESPVPSCSDGSGVVWYTLTARRRGPMVATIVAGKVDAGLVVYRDKRSTREELVCRTTDRFGTVSVPWFAHRGDTFLVGVMRRETSDPGAFTLTIVDREPTPRPPGEPLPAAGVTSTVAPLVDAADAWSVQMKRGTSYKLYVETTADACVDVGIYRPLGYSFADEQPVERGTVSCGGYTLFTPGIDGGGTYSLLVTPSEGKGIGPRPYRLVLLSAAGDDTAPGIALTSGTPVSGALATEDVDLVDLYAFTVPRDNSLTTIDLRPGPRLRYDLSVVDETGKRVLGVEDTRGAREIQEMIPKGRYFLALTAVRRSHGVYRLEVLTREVTSTAMTASGEQFVEAAPGVAVPLAVSVTAAGHGGTVNIEIDRFDPIFGWQFATVISTEVDADGRVYSSWTPPWVGHWRALARYAGNVYSTPSQSDYVRVHVAVPFET